MWLESESDRRRVGDHDGLVRRGFLPVGVYTRHDDLLAGIDVVLSDDVLDRIDQIVPPGTDIGILDQAYVPPAIEKTELRRRPFSERSVA